MRCIILGRQADHRTWPGPISPEDVLMLDATDVSDSLTFCYSIIPPVYPSSFNALCSSRAGKTRSTKISSQIYLCRGRIAGSEAENLKIVS